MNVYDSERMADVLAADGYGATERPEDADLVLLNTCHIREKAAEKVYSELGRLRVLKERARARRPRHAHRRRRLRRAGRRRGNPRAARRPSTSWSGRRATTACRSFCARRRQRAVETDFPAESKFDHMPRAAGRAAAGAAPASAPSSPCRRAATSSAPSASCPIRAARSFRGRSRQIVAEAERLAARGVKEITLLGQNVNAYHGEGPDGATWSLGEAARAAFRDRRHRAAALHDQPSARHGATT